MSPNAMAHGRAIAGAKALHAVGHISDKQMSKHVSKSQGAIKAMAKAQPKTPKPTGVTKDSPSAAKMRKTYGKKTSNQII